MTLAGKAAVVTGGASGIGLGIARALVEKDCRVMLADIDGSRLDAAAQTLRDAGGTAETAICDVSDHAAVEALADAAWATFGSVQLVFNNAGVMSTSPIIDADPAEVDWMIDINVKGVWNGCSVFGKRFRDSGEDCVIGITASEHALGVPHLGGGIYTGTKHALLGMADVLRQEVPDNIKVSLVFPGIVQTELYDAQRSSPAGRAPEKVRAFGQRAMSFGMDPLYIGRRVVAGAEDGEFLVMTHPHVVAFAETRWKEVEAAFARAPEVEDPAQYSVERVMQKLRDGSD
ncbi:MAG: SDR family NAD(P)-dependent oxidoreductase [Alphaproteobacteria bacterium]